MNKRLHEKAHSHVKKAIDEILSGSLPSITSPQRPSLPKLEIDEMMKNELEPIKCTLNLNLKRSSSPSSSTKTSSSDQSSYPKKRLRSRVKPASNEAPSSSGHGTSSRRHDTWLRKMPFRPYFPLTWSNSSSLLYLACSRWVCFKSCYFLFNFDSLAFGNKISVWVYHHGAQNFFIVHLLVNDMDSTLDGTLFSQLVIGHWLEMIFIYL